jgi:hypothetical protein
MARHVPQTGETKNSYRVLVGKWLGKWLLSHSRRKQEDNSQADLMLVWEVYETD